MYERKGKRETERHPGEEKERVEKIKERAEKPVSAVSELQQWIRVTGKGTPELQSSMNRAVSLGLRALTKQ